MDVYTSALLRERSTWLLRVEGATNSVYVFWEILAQILVRSRIAISTTWVRLSSWVWVATMKVTTSVITMAKAQKTIG